MRRRCAVSELVRVIEIRCPNCGPGYLRGEDKNPVPNVVKAADLRDPGNDLCCVDCGESVLIATEPVEEPRP